MRRLVLALAVVLTLATACDTERPPLRVATFNIENYPKNETQKTRAVDVIRDLDVEIVAVQEILDPVLFAQQITTRLGPDWTFVYTIRGPRQKLGVAYDRSVFELTHTDTHDETVVRRGAKPTFEVRLRRRADGSTVRVFVVHFKAGGDYFRVRARQHFNLSHVIKQAMESEDEVVLLGDFNSTGFPDRIALWAFSAWTDTHWSSRPLPCTQYWQRDEDCETTPLDHVLSSRPGEIDFAGACADIGCDVDDRCPLWTNQVSDHCPVIVDFVE